MKKVIGTLILLVAIANMATAQRYAYVDTQYILESIPEFTDAQTELDKLSEQWVKEVDDKFALVQTKRNEFEAEKILLPEEIKKQRLKEINTLESQAKETTEETIRCRWRLVHST